MGLLEPDTQATGLCLALMNSKTRKRYEKALQGLSEVITYIKLKQLELEQKPESETRKNKLLRLKQLENDCQKKCEILKKTLCS